MARCPRPCPHPRAALCIGVFEGQRAYGGRCSSSPNIPNGCSKRATAGLRTALQRRARSTPPAWRCWRPTSSPTPMCARSPGAGRKDGRRARQVPAAPRHRRVGMGQIFRPRSGAGPPPRHRAVAPARALHRADEAKAAGLYMICTLSKQQAEQRGYRRRVDVRLARPGRRGDRRQRLLRRATAAAHADAGLFPRRDHPPDGDGPRRRSAGSKCWSARSGPRSSKGSNRCS